MRTKSFSLILPNCVAWYKFAMVITGPKFAYFGYKLIVRSGFIPSTRVQKFVTQAVGVLKRKKSICSKVRPADEIAPLQHVRRYSVAVSRRAFEFLPILIRTCGLPCSSFPMSADITSHKRPAWMVLVLRIP